MGCARQRRNSADHRALGRDPGPQDQAPIDHEGKNEVKDRPRRHRGRARPKRRTVHGVALFVRRKPGDGCGILARGRIRIALELNITAQRNGRDLPACAATVDAVEEHRAKAKAEHFGMDPAPAAHDVMAVFVDKDDDADGQNEKGQRPKKAARAEHRRQNVH